MRTAVSALSLLVAIGSGPAMANCASDTVNPTYVLLNQSQVTTLLVGNTACYPNGGPPWENQEYLSGGTIIDYRLGSNPQNPTGPVGAYTINSDGSINYTYTSAPGFTYMVFGPNTAGTPGLYDFCNTTTQTFLPHQVNVILGGSVPCRSGAAG